MKAKVYNFMRVIRMESYREKDFDKRKMKIGKA